MTRDEALREQRAITHPTSTLPEVCMDLRMAVNGSADGWDVAYIRRVVRMLQSRLATWQPTLYEKSRRVDAAVHALVEATLAEVQSYDWWQEPGVAKEDG